MFNKMKNLFFFNKGRLGNALFRYFAMIIIIMHNKNFKYGGLNKNYSLKIIPISDNIFKQILENKKFIINNNENYIFDGFYQYQELVDYKEKIKFFLNNNSQDIIYNYPYEEFKISDIVNERVNLNIYDIVLHIRLEDFVDNNEYIKCCYLIDLLNKLSIDFFYNSKICIVVNKITTEFEKKYLNNIILWFNKNNLNIDIESNDIITDFHIMKNAKKLICSRSTISWCAAFLSDNIEICYMPDYKIDGNRPFQTFKYPIKNTILYSIYD